MSAETIVMIITAAISLLSLFVSYLTSEKANKIALQNAVLTTENTRLSNGSMEIQIREMISLARRHLASAIQNIVMSKINPNFANNKDMQGLVDNLLHDAQQDYLNAYEEACMKYIDNKVDKARFEKTYKKEIRNIVENETYKKYLTDFSSSYYAIKKVYDQWNNLER